MCKYVKYSLFPPLLIVNIMKKVSAKYAAKYIFNHKYSKTPAIIRSETSLCKEEIDFIEDCQKIGYNDGIILENELFCVNNNFELIPVRYYNNEIRLVKYEKKE